LCLCFVLFVAFCCADDNSSPWAIYQKISGALPDIGTRSAGKYCGHHTDAVPVTEIFIRIFFGGGDLNRLCWEKETGRTFKLFRSSRCTALPFVSSDREEQGYDFLFCVLCSYISV
jgi:hypothetical protein